jgi:small subunit ribosomal protein S7
MLKYIDPTFSDPSRLLRNKIPFCERVDLKNAIGFVTDPRLTERMPEFGKDNLNLNLSRLFSSKLIRRGKKRLAENLFNSVLDNLRRRGVDRPVAYVEHVVRSLRMSASTRIYKKGRRTLHVPYLLQPSAQYPMVARWLIRTARGHRADHGLSAKLSAEIYDAYHQKGHAVQKRFELENLIKSNFSTFRLIRRWRRPRGKFRQ